MLGVALPVLGSVRIHDRSSFVCVLFIGCMVAIFVVVICAFAIFVWLLFLRGVPGKSWQRFGPKKFGLGNSQLADP